MAEKKKSKKAVKPVKKAFKRPNINLLVPMAVLFVALFVVIFQVQQMQDTRGRAQVGTDCTVTEAEVAIDSEEQLLFELVNQYRLENGSTALQFATTLNRDAAWLSKDMNAHSTLNHVDSLGRTFFQRSVACGQPQNSGGEENIYQGTEGAQGVFNLWKASTQGHNEAMLRPANLYVGISRNGNYWTMSLSPVKGSDTASPTSAVPSPQCLGACPTPTTTVLPSQIITNIPSEVPTPVVSPTSVLSPTSGIEPTISIPAVTIPVEPTQPTNTPPAGGEQGIIGIILAFLMLILEFFRSLFGK